MIFADTNVLLYAFDEYAPAKQERSRHLLTQHWQELVVSTQVLIEFHAAASRKLGLDANDRNLLVQNFACLEVVPTDRAAVLAAAELADTTGLSIFDALVAEASIRSGCESLLTEDSALLEAELPIAVENPFA